MKIVSVIIPTHNRSRPLKRLLNGLANQTFPPESMEVIVAADGCTDDTVQMLREYRAPYDLLWVEQAGQGAAVARNAGVSKASAELFIFIDDDIDPSADLVTSHVLLHNRPNKVIIGYLPVPHPTTDELYYINLWAWWEGKYQQMRDSWYQFSYTDLLSGNFSVSRQLFEATGKFDTSLRCREDYELGVRLIKLGADFEISTNAWGYHRDEVTNSNRLFQRKLHEGVADVKFAHLHPDLIPNFHVAQFKGVHSWKKKSFLFFLYNLPAVSDFFARVVGFLFPVFEKLRMHYAWHKSRGLLCNYWYFRGMTKETKTIQDLRSLSSTFDAQEGESNCMRVDLAMDLMETQRRVDKMRPEKIQFFYGDAPIGFVQRKGGAEKIRGAHLKNMIAEEDVIALLQLEELIDTTGNRKTNSETAFEQTTIKVPF